MKLKSFREWAKTNLKREDNTAGDPKDLLQRAQVCLGKAQDDEIKSFLNDIISFLQEQSGEGGDQQGGDQQSDQATDGASNMAGDTQGMQTPMQSGGGMQAGGGMM